jgi:hypothetical protein
MNKFINRESELAQLEAKYAGNTGNLVVLYGRRHLCKTFLLRQFVSSKPHCYFMADRAGESDLRRSLAKAMVLVLGGTGSRNCGICRLSAVDSGKSARIQCR